MSPRAVSGPQRPLHFPKVALPVNTVIHGDCEPVLAGLPAESVDFVLTDPPYICGYRDRQGRTVANDTSSEWLEPAFRDIYRPDEAGYPLYQLLRLDGDRGVPVRMAAAGFRRVGHLVFARAMLHAGGCSVPCTNAPMCWPKAIHRYPHSRCPMCRGGRTPATSCTRRKSRSTCGAAYPHLLPCGRLVLDPFCGSGSTLVAAQACDGSLSVLSLMVPM